MVAATAEAQKKLDEAVAAATAAKSALEGKADDAALKAASEAADKAQPLLRKLSMRQIRTSSWHRKVLSLQQLR